MAIRKGGGYVEGAPKKTRQGAGGRSQKNSSRSRHEYEVCRDFSQ
jgi:hypothetical protein